MHGDFLRAHDLCYILKEEIAPKLKLSDFEDMYSGVGRPPVSPKTLVLVLLLQFLEKLTDRAAANNLRFRLDWKIALGLEVDFPGIHPTTLVYFRDRLLANNKACYAFDSVIEHLVEAGLVKKGQKQRIDSTHIVGNVRELSRLDLLHETLRLFCLDAKPYQSLMSATLEEKQEYYSEDISIRGIGELQKAKYLREAGLTMRVFVDWVARLPEDNKLQGLQSFKTLAMVFLQNFHDDGIDPEGPKLIKIATGKDHLCSPHEVDARFANKGSKKWIGYKAQVAETIPETEGEIGFITFVEVQDAPEHDSSAVATYLNYQEDKKITPTEVYGDTHYNSSKNIESLAEASIQLKGPVNPVPTKEIQEKNRGFEVSEQEMTVFCPKGNKAEKYSQWKDERILGRFNKDDCIKCERNSICLPGKGGKQIVIRPESALLKERRSLMETEAFKIDMHKRNGIEGTISGLVRGNGMRRSRFRGKEKTMLHVKFCGAAANISRLHRKRTIEMKISA